MVKCAYEALRATNEQLANKLCRCHSMKIELGAPRGCSGTYTAFKRLQALHSLQSDLSSGMILKSHRGAWWTSHCLSSDCMATTSTCRVRLRSWWYFGYGTPDSVPNRIHARPV